MLLTTPENTRWRRWAWWMLLPLVGSYMWYATREYPHGGTPMGIAYGALGVLIILILMFYGIRKRAYTSTFGTLQTWLHAHIYLGLLVLVIILFHSGFRFHDKVAVTALILMTIVALSGVLGAFLYTVVPPLHTDVESNLTAGEMSEQVNQLARSMARLASGKSAAFQAVYASLTRAEHPRSLAGWRIMRGLYGSRRSGKDEGDALQAYLGRVDPTEQADLTQLLVLARQMREMHDRLVQKQRYRNILEVWLYLHVPLSFALLLAVTAHVIAAFYYW